MVFWNLQSQRRELIHVLPVELHKPVVFRGKYEWSWVAEVYKTKMPARTYFAVNHGSNFARSIIRIVPQRVSSGDGLRQPEIDFLEEFWCGLAILIQLRKHERLERVMHGRRNLGGDDPVSLRIHQQHSGSRIELWQILGDSH